MQGLSASAFSKFGTTVSGNTETMSGFLTEGVYSIQFTNSGRLPLSLTWTIRQNTPKDSLLANGIGQGGVGVSIANNGSSMLGLLSVDPSLGGPLSGGGSAGFGPNAVAPSPSSPSTGSGSGGTSSTGNPTANPGFGGGFSVGPSFAPVSPGGVFFSVASLPVGRPSSQNDQVEAAGSGGIAMASNSTGLMQGIGYGQGRIGGFDRFGESLPGDPPVPAAPNNNGAMEVADQPASSSATQADEIALVNAEWLGRVGTFAADWLKLAPQTQEVASVTPGSEKPEMISAPLEARARTECRGFPEVGASRASEFRCPDLPWSRLRARPAVLADVPQVGRSHAKRHDPSQAWRRWVSSEVPTASSDRLDSQCRKTVSWIVARGP